MNSKNNPPRRNLTASLLLVATWGLWLSGCGIIGGLPASVAPETKQQLASPTSSPNGLPLEATPTEGITTTDTPVPVELNFYFDELKSLTVLVETGLIASPRYADVLLPGSLIKSGEEVQIIAGDMNSAWLLVLHKNQLGWIPTIYTAGIANLKPSVVSFSNQAGCGQFLGTLNPSQGIWESNYSGGMDVEGYVYRPKGASLALDMDVAFKFEETGQEIRPQLNSVVLDEGGELLTFLFPTGDLERGHHVIFHMTGLDPSATPFQASFYSQDCSNASLGFTSGEKEAQYQAATPTMSSITLVITSEGSLHITPTPIFDWAACHAGYTTRFRVGKRGYVDDSTSLPNRVREKPYKDSAILGRISPGERFTVIKGPSCSNGWIWWKVKADIDGLTGWTVEGDSKKYWLVPIN